MTPCTRYQNTSRTSSFGLGSRGWLRGLSTVLCLLMMLVLEPGEAEAASLFGWRWAGNIAYWHFEPSSGGPSPIDSVLSR